VAVWSLQNFRMEPELPLHDDSDDDQDNNDGPPIAVPAGGGDRLARNIRDGMEPELPPHEDSDDDQDNNNVPPIAPIAPIAVPAGGGDRLANIRDGVVAERTLTSYINDLLAFLNWCRENEEFDCLTDYGKNEIANMHVRQNGEGNRPFTMRIRSTFKAILRNAHVQPIVHLDRITPEGFMNYVLSLRHPSRGGSLSRSSYGSKRAALFHLFRVHNRTGMPPEFANQLSYLFRGFYRTLTQRRADLGGGGNAGHVSHRGDGKAPMSVALYEKLCGWLLALGTTDGLFAHCFLTLTWNLSCRSQNTSLIKFRDISWSTSFDTFQVFFEHSKTDQLGDESKYPRHLYANPLVPCICPVMSLTLYFSACFNCAVTIDGYLFPGRDQEERFSKILQRILAQHEAEVNELGYPLQHLGTHSIRKGAVSYLSSAPGGPQAAAVCIRAGWTMGKVKDTYMRYIDSGDQFVGRCLALLPLLSSQFACSPPYFSNDATDDEKNWFDSLRLSQFPMVAGLPNYGLLTRMCLASLLYHRHWILENFMVNHVVRCCSVVLRHAAVIERCDRNPNLVRVSYPWNDRGHIYTGIPPHVSTLQELTLLREEQKNLIDGFVDRVKLALQEYGVDNERLTVENLNRILNNFRDELQAQLRTVVNAQQGTAVPGERVETGGYTMHCHSGGFKRVPVDWRFPRCGVFDLWRQWWIGDQVRQVPPLRFLTTKDVNFLDTVPLSDEEMHGRTGGKRENRRLARKTLNDMQFIMTWITKKVQAAGAMEEEITLSLVDRMFAVVTDEFSEGERNGQKKWSTIVRVLQKKQTVAV